jgi:uncharacterized RDD family membrane protein YckC
MASTASAGRGMVHVAADEQTLWLAATDGQRTHVYRRRPNEAFHPLEPLNGAITRMVVSNAELFAFVEDEAFYSLSGEGWTRERDLPLRRKPLDLMGDETGVYALTLSPPAGEMIRFVGEGRSATTAPFDAGDAPLTLVRYENQGWVALAACPRKFLAAGARLPRLAILQRVPCLLWYAEPMRQIECVRLDRDSDNWLPGPATPTESAPGAFWVAAISRVPALLMATPATDDGQPLAALRLLGALDGTSTEWRPAALDLSALPAGVRSGRYADACGFNQHAVFLMATPSGAAYIRFGRIDAPPTEVTASVAEVLSGRRAAGRELAWLQAVTLVVLVLLLLALFVLRRGAMVAVLTLPADCALAFAVQRLGGFVIDLIPFAAVAAVVVGVDWPTALRELAGWAFGSGAAGGKLPGSSTLLWWGASCGTYTVYSLVMELLTRRTVGKTLIGTRVLSEAASKPQPWQIVVRNALRCIELMPPFWVLGFVVVLSRNRQRVGDIFARTIVVRRVRPAID